MKILIAVPTFENILPECFQSIYDLDKDGHDVHFEFVKGYDCAKARNMIVKTAIEGGYDYTLMVDSDIVLPPDTLKIFLSDPCPIIMGLYPKKRTANSETTLVKPDAKDNNNRYFYHTLPKEQRFPIRAGGFGCVLIHKDVFKHLSYPYFLFEVHKYGTFLSEDYYFCKKAREAGYTIWADSRVRCGHVVKSIQYE